MTVLVESYQGVAQVSHGNAILIDWDEMNDLPYLKNVLRKVIESDLPDETIARILNLASECLL